jgi:DMSO/TMAO reductase YedYZ molybdopterin-dependent catalytic subunit
MSSNRRELFAALIAAGAVRLGAADDPVVVRGKAPMIVHNDRPEDLETPLRHFDSYLTPIEVFFVRQHIPRPSPIDPAAYRLTISGMVSKPVELTVVDLQKLPQHTLPVVIECTGNGAAFILLKCRASNGAGERSATPSGRALASRTC